MSRRHKWIFVGMIALPFIIALGFRTFDNYQFHKYILSNSSKSSINSPGPADQFEDDCKEFILNFKVNF